MNSDLHLRYVTTPSHSDHFLNEYDRVAVILPMRPPVLDQMDAMALALTRPDLAGCSGFLLPADSALAPRLRTASLHQDADSESDFTDRCAREQCGFFTHYGDYVLTCWWEDKYNEKVSAELRMSPALRAAMRAAFTDPDADRLARSCAVVKVATTAPDPGDAATDHHRAYHRHELLETDRNGNFPGLHGAYLMKGNEEEIAAFDTYLADFAHEQRLPPAPASTVHGLSTIDVTRRLEQKSIGSGLRATHDFVAESGLGL